MTALLNTNRFMDAGIYYYLLAWYAHVKGDLAYAHEQAQLSFDFAVNSGNLFFVAISRNELGRTFFYKGEHIQAKELIQQARSYAREMSSMTLEYLCFLSEAEFALVLGDEPSCIEALHQCLAVGRQQGFQNHTWWHSNMMARLYAVALKNNIETDYVKALIKKRGMVPPEEPHNPDLWPFPIKLYTFGRFSLLIDDKPVQFTNRGQKKPIELLKALIALGGRDVPQAEIIDLLWPDTEGDASYRSLITCLQRLRNIIGYKDAIIHTESRMTLDTRYIWSDNWAFERLINHAEVMEKEGSQDKACETRIKALGYYKGSFLEKDAEMAWTLSMREQLRVKFIRQVELIGRYWEGANNWDKALECYQEALAIDNLSEVFYQRLMTAYKMLGRDSDAVVLAYQRCCKELSSRLGIPPSPATEEIYNSIQKR